MHSPTALRWPMPDEHSEHDPWLDHVRRDICYLYHLLRATDNSVAGLRLVDLFTMDYWAYLDAGGVEASWAGRSETEYADAFFVRDGSAMVLLSLMAETLARADIEYPRQLDAGEAWLEGLTAVDQISTRLHEGLLSGLELVSKKTQDAGVQRAFETTRRWAYRRCVVPYFAERAKGGDPG